MHITNPRKRIREIIGLALLVLVAMGFGLVIDRYADSAHARWMAIAVVVLFLVPSVGITNWMSRR